MKTILLIAGLAIAPAAAFAQSAPPSLREAKTALSDLVEQSLRIFEDEVETQRRFAEGNAELLGQDADTYIRNIEDVYYNRPVPEIQDDSGIRCVEAVGVPGFVCALKIKQGEDGIGICEARFLKMADGKCYAFATSYGLTPCV